MKQILVIFTLLISNFTLFAQSEINNLPQIEDLNSVADTNPAFLTKFLNFQKDLYLYVPEILTEEDATDTTIFKDNVILSLDSTIAERLENLNTIFHLKYNDKTRRLIDVYTSQRAVLLPKMLALSQYYFPIFENIFAEEGLPEELKYVSIIESALNPRAGSRKGAFGLWQFMPATGRAYGLRIDDDIDERLDPIKSTQAAARYLRSLHNIYGDWSLAIAAYNCGPGRVNRAVKRSGGKNDFWQIYNNLPHETRNYVPAFIGATYSMNYYCEHDIDIGSIFDHFPEVVDTALVDTAVFFIAVNKFANVPLQTIKDYNPHFKRDFIPATADNPFVLTLPKVEMDKYRTSLDSIIVFSYKAKRIRDSIDEWERIHHPKDITHIVKSGETLSSIAHKYGVSVKSIKAWNNKKSDMIRPKDKIVIKGKRS
jgi:membrane-bound lytic murein transglycosylase D